MQCPATLKGVAQTWFNKILPYSIKTEELSSRFISHFIVKKTPKSIAQLMKVIPRDEEYVLDYSNRLNKEVLSMEDLMLEVALAAFTNIVVHPYLRERCVRKPQTTLLDILKEKENCI